MDTEFDQQMDENKEEIQNILDEFNLTDTLNASTNINNI